MQHIVADLCHEYHGQFHPSNLFSDLRNNLTRKANEYIISQAEAYSGYEYPYISATMFMNFYRTGNRTDFENVYFKKRRVLNSLVLGEYIEQKGRFIDDIINGIFSICEESAWQLPPHNTYIRDTPQLILPDADHPVLDLFACETGAQLATIYHLLKPSLDKVSPFICNRIESELQKRIIVPYLQTHFWWMGHGDEPMCNWTIWCTQNILLTASMQPLSNDVYEKIVRKACVSTDYFLKEYGIDGCCDEGAQYYRHAGLCLYLTIELLNNICENAFSSLWQNEKIKNIAEYICNVHVEDIYYINYADCSPIAGRAGIREFLFGKAVKSLPLCSFAALDFCADSDCYIESEINLAYRLLTFLHEKEVIDYASLHPTQIPAHNVWYESVGIYIARTSKTCLAVKAGNNDDNHNHNDTGSVILYYDGKPVLIDIGVESYTKKTFSPDRYEIWTMQSGFHNLPTICGFDQLDGSEYQATNVNVSNNGLHTISMDIEEAYPQYCPVKKYSRCITLSDTDDVITLKDNFSFKKNTDDMNVILNFITYEKPSFKDNILSIGSFYSFAVKGIESCIIETLPIEDERLKTTWKHEIYRIRFTSDNTEFCMKTIF